MKLPFAFTPALFTFDAAAHYLGVSKGTIKEWYADGLLRAHELPPIRGRERMDKIVFERSELERCANLHTDLRTEGKR